MCRHIGKKKVFYEEKKGFTASVKIFLDKIRDMIDKKESSSAGRKTAKFTKKSGRFAYKRPPHGRKGRLRRASAGRRVESRVRKFRRRCCPKARARRFGRQKGRRIVARAEGRKGFYKQLLTATILVKRRSIIAVWQRIRIIEKGRKRTRVCG